MKRLFITMLFVCTFVSIFAQDKKLITAHGWTIKALLVSGKDMTIFTPPCSKDNVITFYEDGTFTLDEGEKKCNANGPQILHKGKWSYDGETFIMDTRKGKIVQLDEKLFKFILSEGGMTQETTYQSI